MTTPHPHNEFLHALADGRGDEFECHNEVWGDGAWRPGTAFAGAICSYPDEWTVRRKPKTIRIGEMEVPEPMRVAPPDGTIFWLVETNADVSYPRPWSCGRAQERWLAYGLCQATEKGAIDQRRAMILSVGGTP